MAVKFVQSVSVQSVQILRRTSIKTPSSDELAEQRPIAGSMAANGKAVAVIDEKYDLTQENDRRDLFDKIIREMYGASERYDYSMLDCLAGELQDAINVFKNELPFN